MTKALLLHCEAYPWKTVCVCLREKLWFDLIWQIWLSFYVTVPLSLGTLVRESRVS